MTLQAFFAQGTQAPVLSQVDMIGWGSATALLTANAVPFCVSLQATVPLPLPSLITLEITIFAPVAEKGLTMAVTALKTSVMPLLDIDAVCATRSAEADASIATFCLQASALHISIVPINICLLYTSDAADDLL